MNFLMIPDFPGYKSLEKRIKELNVPLSAYSLSKRSGKLEKEYLGLSYILSYKKSWRSLMFTFNNEEVYVKNSMDELIFTITEGRISLPEYGLGGVVSRDLPLSKQEYLFGESLLFKGQLYYIRISSNGWDKQTVEEYLQFSNSPLHFYIKGLSNNTFELSRLGGEQVILTDQKSIIAL